MKKMVFGLFEINLGDFYKLLLERKELIEVPFRSSLRDYEEIN